MIWTGSYTVTRYGAGTYTDGRWVRSTTPSSLTIQASIQPADERQTQTLPEGIRQEVTLRCYTLTPLLAADQRTNLQGDRIAIDGETYEVAHVQTERALIPHTLAHLMRVTDR
jgi:hypothetical protein